MQYKSRFTDHNKDLTAAQWLAEQMCERQAAAQNKRLPIKFWSTDTEWNKIWVLQAIFASRLLKKYSEQAIIAAINSKRGRTVYSLANKFLIPLIETAQNDLACKTDTVKEELRQKEAQVEQPRPNFNKSQSLRDL